MEYERRTSPSFKERLRQTLCLSCRCFSNGGRESVNSFSSGYPPTLVRASSTWLKTRAHELPEIKVKRRNLIGRRRSSSADFRYDPLSYALNFDEGFEHTYLDEAPFRNSSSRVPVSPPLKTVSDVDDLVKPVAPRAITCG